VWTYYICKPCIQRTPSPWPYIVHHHCKKMSVPFWKPVKWVKFRVRQSWRRYPGISRVQCSPVASSVRLLRPVFVCCKSTSLSCHVMLNFDTTLNFEHICRAYVVCSLQIIEITSTKYWLKNNFFILLEFCINHSRVEASWFLWDVNNHAAPNMPSILLLYYYTSDTCR
jgi:hypothetical protein